MLTPHPLVGCIMIDGEDAILSLVKGPWRTILKKMDTRITSSTRRGGQSAPRIGRIHDRDLLLWKRGVGEAAGEVYKDKDVDFFALGGPGLLKRELMKELPSSFSVKFVKDIGLGEEVDFYEEVEKVSLEIQRRDEEVFMERIYEEMTRTPDYYAIGEKECKKDLKIGLLSDLYLEKDIAKNVKERIRERCDAFGTTLHLLPFSSSPTMKDFRVMGKKRYIC